VQRNGLCLPENRTELVADDVADLSFLPLQTAEGQSQSQSRSDTPATLAASSQNKPHAGSSGARVLAQAPPPSALPPPPSTLPKPKPGQSRAMEKQKEPAQASAQRPRHDPTAAGMALLQQMGRTTSTGTSTAGSSPKVMGQELPPGFVAVPGFPGGLPASEAEVLLHSLPKQRKVGGSRANGPGDEDCCGVLTTSQPTVLNRSQVSVLE
jgi:hypothetical protein